MRLLAFLLMVFGLSAREVRVTILATTDLHGNIYPWDYLTGKPSERGLAKIATLIQQQRQESPGALLVDAGDTIQGAPLESVWQTWVRTGKLPLNLRFPGQTPQSDPMMLVMNHLRFDAMAVGNHEFNYGLRNLEKARSEAKFPWLAANIRASESRKPFEAYVVRETAGVKVGIIGLTTPAVPAWEKPENYHDYTFADPKASVEAAVKELRSKEWVDLVVVVAHAGLDRDLKSGAVRPGEIPHENFIYRIASEVEGIDAIIFGHTHSQLETYRIGNVMLCQPKNWGISLARLDFTLTSRSQSDSWDVSSKASRLLPVTSETAADPEVLRLARPYHEITEQYLNSPVTTSATAVNASKSRIEDSAIIDAIHTVQLHYAKADVSLAASFNPRASIPEGGVTVRQIAGLYIYDNELYAIEGNGRMIREALENAASYFNSCRNAGCDSGPLINRSFIGYNFDTAGGVSYEIDLAQPRGSRIRNLKYRGAPLADDRKLRIALNNYRAGGSGGYTMLKGAPVVWRSFRDIRDLMIEYYSTHPLPATPDSNWSVLPAAARTQLNEEVRAESRSFSNQ